MRDYRSFSPFRAELATVEVEVPEDFVRNETLAAARSEARARGFGS